MHAKILDLLRAQKNVPVLSEVAAYHLTEAGAFADEVKDGSPPVYIPPSNRRIS